MDQLWRRFDLGAVFMCGLPYACAEPRPFLIAAPVPAPDEFHGRCEYWSDLVVRKDSEFRSLEDTFGHRIAFTMPNSQSGCAAALQLLMRAAGPRPLFRELIAPQVTPLRAMTAVIEGSAEVAPIDSYAFALLQRYRSELTAQLRVVATTERTVIPPLVSSFAGLKSLEAAFLGAHDDEMLRPLLEKLLLERFERPNPDSYDLLRNNYAAAARYWREHPLAITMHPAFAMKPLGSAATD
jgi:ABC-type phosphate/phosphonate transport system substrate-binding protein